MSGSNAAHPHLDERETKRTLRWLNAHGTLRSAYEAIASANSFVCTPFLHAIGIASSDMGLVFGAQSFAAAAQVLGLPMVSRSKNPKLLIYAIGVVQPIALSLLMVSLLWVPASWRLIVMLAAIFPIHAIWQAIVPLTDDWVATVLPASIRGRFMSLRKQLFAAGFFVFSLVAGKAVKIIGENNATGLAILLAALCVPAVIAAVAMNLASMPAPAHDAKPFNLLRLPAVLTQSRFRRFLVVSLLMQLPFTLAMPLYNVIYYEQFHLTGDYIGTLSAVCGAIKLIVFPLWGRAVDQSGPRRVLLRVGPIYTLFFLGFAFAAPEYWWLAILVQLLAALGDAAWGVAFPLVLYKVVPQGNERPAYFAAYSLIVLCANAIGAFLTKPVLAVLAKFCRDYSFASSAYHVLFALLTIAMACVSFSLLWLEPDEA